MRSLFAAKLLSRATSQQGSAPEPAPEVSLQPIDPGAWRAWAESAAEPVVPQRPAPTAVTRTAAARTTSGS